MQNRPSIDRITRALSEILSDKHGLSVLIEAVPINEDRSPRDREEGASA